MGSHWPAGGIENCLVHFDHEGKTIVNPYSYLPANQNPADMFGEGKMNAWKDECADLFDEYKKDA